MGYDFIGCGGALQGGAGVAVLAAGLFAAGFSKALVLLWAVRVLRWRCVGVAAVFFVLINGQLLFEMFVFR